MIHTTLGRHPQKNREQTRRETRRKPDTNFPNGNQEDNQGIGEKVERGLVE
jgi:hypothetical protein